MTEPYWESVIEEEAPEAPHEVLYPVPAVSSRVWIWQQTQEYEVVLDYINGNRGFVRWDWNMDLYRRGMWEDIDSIRRVLTDLPPRRRCRTNFYRP